MKRTTVWRPAVLILGALLSGGCGVAEYEERLKFEQERIDYLDEENRYLDAYLDVPVIKTREGEPDLPEVYLRPPKGIRAQYDGAPLGGFLFRYPRNRDTPGVVSEMYLGRSVDRKEVLRDVTQMFVPPALVRNATATRRPFGRPAMNFSALFYDDPRGTSHLAVYAYQQGLLQVAIIYRVDKGQWTPAQKAIELSLATLAVGEAATKLREADAARLGRSPPEPPAAPTPRPATPGSP